MAYSTNEENRKKSFIRSLLGLFFLIYILFSLFRFFIYDESILSTDSTVILTALIIAVLLKVTPLLQSLFKFDRTKKNSRYFLFPIRSAIMTYLVLSLARYVILQESILSKNAEVISLAVMIGLIEGVSAKIDDISPRNPEEEPAKPLKYYTDKFIVNATPFHKVMFAVYGICILSFILIVWLVG